MARCVAVLLAVVCSACEGAAGAQGPERVDAGLVDAGESDGGAVTVASGGLRLEISSATIAAGGTVSAIFRITGADGVPLVLTEGVVAASFVLSALGAGVGVTGPGVYAARTARTKAGVRKGLRLTLRQASADTGGGFEALGAGTYRYTFGASASAAAGRAYTIAAWATRTRGGARDVATTVYALR